MLYHWLFIIGLNCIGWCLSPFVFTTLTVFVLRFGSLRIFSAISSAIFVVVRSSDLEVEGRELLRDNLRLSLSRFRSPLLVFCIIFRSALSLFVFLRIIDILGKSVRGYSFRHTTLLIPSCWWPRQQVFTWELLSIPPEVSRYLPSVRSCLMIA